MLSCRACSEGYEIRKQTAGFIEQHKSNFAEVLRTPEERGATEQKESKLSWKGIEAKEKKEKTKSLQFSLLGIGAVAACMVIGLLTWMVFSTHSKPQTLPQGSSIQQVAPAPKPSIKVELIANTGNVSVPGGQQVISTGQLKTLLIEGKHRMVMNTNTILAVEPLVENSNIGCLVKLDSGQIFTHVEHDGNPFVVDTACGEAVITGTIFDIKATDTSTTLVVSEGVVQFESEKGAVEVTAGQVSEIVGQSAPSRPVLCNAAELTAWATGYKASPVLAQVTPTKSYPDTSNSSWPTDEETTVLEENSEGIRTAAELIEQAHKHDAAYVVGASVNRQKALRLYQSALGTEPDDKQRLHILYRLAQLHGMTYRKDKGEKPNYRRAIELYQEIIDSYPPGEPEVTEAMLWIGGHQTARHKFENAIQWFKKALEYDTARMAEQLKDIEQKKQALERDPHEQGNTHITAEQELEIREQIKQGDSLEKSLAKIKRYQEIAVDHVAYVAERIHPLRVHGELRVIVEEHASTFIAERAAKLLQQHMDKMPSLWAPQNDEPFSPSGSTLQAAASAPAAHTESQKHKGIKTQADTVSDVTKKHYAVEPNTAEIRQKDKHVETEPRAPPLSNLSFIGAAGLIVLALAAIIVKKRKTSF